MPIQVFLSVECCIANLFMNWNCVISTHCYRAMFHIFYSSKFCQEIFSPNFNTVVAFGGLKIQVPNPPRSRGQCFEKKTPDILKIFSQAQGSPPRPY